MSGKIILKALQSAVKNLSEKWKATVNTTNKIKTRAYFFMAKIWPSFRILQVFFIEIELLLH